MTNFIGQVSWDVIETPVGQFYGANRGSGLWRVAFGALSESAFLQTFKDTYILQRDAAALAPTMVQVRAYFARERLDFDLPLDLSDRTPFQRKVLLAVKAVSPGTTQTYQQVAQTIGQPQAYRAVGAANGSNPLPLVIPCHRLVGSDGKLHGYGSGQGLTTKRWLLEFENAL